MAEKTFLCHSTHVTPPMMYEGSKGIHWFRVIQDLCNTEVRNQIIVDLVSKNLEKRIGIATFTIDHVGPLFT
jgi:hypothetical protein